MPGKRLLNKVAIVTGSSQGIGREICIQFYLEGALLICADLKEGTGDAVSTHEEIRQQGGKALFLKTDVSNGEDMERLVNAAVVEYGRIDIIVNNAGIFPELTAPSKPIEEADEDLFQESFAVNTRGTFLGAKFAIRQFRKQESPTSGTRGHVVNVSSTAALTGIPGLPGYTASKGAIIALTRSIAIDVAKSGIVCNCIVPGLIETAGLEASLDGVLQGATPDDLAGQVPMQRLGSTVDIARAAVFLASEDASWITGQTLVVDGGSTAM